MSDVAQANLAAAERYLRAVEAGAKGADLAAYFAADVVQQEFPNRVVPAGARRDLAALLAGAARGQQLLSKQRYEIRNRLASGSHVALEVLWVGTLAVPLGTLPTGAELRAHLGIFLEFENGKIKAQRNYDCYEPW